MSDLAKVAAEHSYHPLVKACRCTMGRVAPVHLELPALLLWTPGDET